MKASYTILIIFLSTFGFSINVQSKECVILLHGLLRSSSAMEKLEHRLKKEDYDVMNINYPSRKYNIEKLSKIAIGKTINQNKMNNYSRINFVTHSLGGILVRFYLKNHTIKNMGRVVMLGPPNKGSEVVDNFKNIPGFKWMNGPAVEQLGTDPSSLPKSLGAVNFELGVIAGTKSINLILSCFLPNPDDGKVSVYSTKVDGLKDFIALPTSHPFMMKNKTVINQTVFFLRNGKFRK